MRENIGLFKAKRIDNGEWVKGNYVKCRAYDHDLIFDDLCRFEVHKNTICEYTGLKKLYEHDFIRFENGAEYEVVFEDFMFKIANETHREALFESEDEDFEITGNRFD